jgi:hypothetical protein
MFSAVSFLVSGVHPPGDSSSESAARHVAAADPKRKIHLPVPGRLGRKIKNRAP